MAKERERRRIEIGRITGLYGVRGWVRIYSYTAPREAILDYSPWQVKVDGGWCEMAVAEGRRHGKGIIARLEGYGDRDAAARLMGADIACYRSQLPQTAPGEYYWADLVGLTVVTLRGEELGVIEGLMETGANDVLVVKGERERLIPCLIGDVVVEVDLAGQQMRVDWDPGF